MTWQRMQTLSGVGFAVLFVVGFLLMGGDTPDYAAPDQEWTKWAADNESSSRISMVLIVLAGFQFLLFAGSIRTALGSAETTANGSTRLTDTAFAGALVAIAGIVMAIVMIGAASLHGAESNPVASRAVIDASTGPFLLGSMGFAALLGAAGLLTLRTRVFARWTGIAAVIGAIAFLVTFLSILDDSDESAFGVGFPIGFLCLAIWSIATSLASHRRLTDTAPAV